MAIVDIPDLGAAAALAGTNLVPVTQGTSVPKRADLATVSTFVLQQIANDSLSFAKLQNIASDRLLGRDTAASGDIEELTVGGGIEFTGGGGIQTAAFTGDVTKAVGGVALTIANDAVTYAKMQNVSATDKLLGRSTAGAGDVEEIACTAAGRALIDDADAAAQRATLAAAGVTAVNNFTNVNQWGTFSATGASNGKQIYDATTGAFIDSSRDTTAAASHQRFYNPNGIVGSIQTSASATAYNTSSDAGLKKGIIDVDPFLMLAKVKAGKAREYEFTAEPGVKRIGFVAQEMEAVCPDAVSPPTPETPTYMMDYSKVTPVLWGGQAALLEIAQAIAGQVEAMRVALVQPRTPAFEAILTKLDALKAA